MIIKLLTEHHLEGLSLNRGCRGSSESTHVKMPHCWKSQVGAQMESDNKITVPLTPSVLRESFIRYNSDINTNLGALPEDEFTPSVLPHLSLHCLSILTYCRLLTQKGSMLLRNACLSLITICILMGFLVHGGRV